MYVNRFEQRNLAWRLMDVVQASLDANARMSLHAQIGAGDLEGALFRLVGFCMRVDLRLPSEVTALLHSWARGYAGTDVATIFARYIGAASPLPRVPCSTVAVEGSTFGPDRNGVFDDRPRRAHAIGATVGRHAAELAVDSIAR